MTTTLDTKFKILSWDERPYRELPDGRKFSRSDVVLKSEDGECDATFEGLLYYRADGTSSYVILMHVDGTLDGRAGGFVLSGTGTFDGGTARIRAGIVPGSGTGELDGITGTAESTSTHADYPFMPLTIRYTIA